MYRPPSKRTQLFQRIAIYTAMSVSVVGLVSILVFFMLGYQINREDGKIAQGGLVQFNTQPAGADVKIDGVTLGTRTASRKTMNAGQHYITMERQGYRTWQKSVDVTAGGVLWLTYARLVPTDLTPTSVASFSTVSSTVASPDNKWMAIKEDPATPVVHLADLSKDEVEVVNIELPAGSYTVPAPDKTHSFSLETWNPTSRFILVKHTYDDAKIEWIVVDTQDVDATKNITTLLGIDATKIVFTSNNPSIVYALVDNDVRKIDLNAATLSGPLIANIAEFSLYDNSTIIYSTLLDPVTKMRSVGYFNDGASKARTIRSYSDNGEVSLHIAVGKYFDDHFIAIAYDKAVEVLKGSLPQSDAATPSALTAFATMNIPAGVQHLSVLTNGRFIVAQTPNSYVTHDLELKKTTSTELKDTTMLTRELRWLDGYTVWNDHGGKLRIYEFDGANQHEIMSVAPGFSATYSPTSKYLYGIAQSSDGKYHLERVRMILP